MPVDTIHRKKCPFIRFKTIKFPYFRLNWCVLLEHGRSGGRIFRIYHINVWFSPFYVQDALLFF